NHPAIHPQAVGASPQAHRNSGSPPTQSSNPGAARASPNRPRSSSGRRRGPGTSARGPGAARSTITARGIHSQAGTRSELVERRLLVGVNLEDLVQPGDAEDLQKVGVDAAELQLAFDRGHLLLEVDQLAERGAGEVLDVAEVQQQALVTFILNQAIELVA